jgi:hypothetical protein
MARLGNTSTDHCVAAPAAKTNDQPGVPA